MDRFAAALAPAVLALVASAAFGQASPDDLYKGLFGEEDARASASPTKDDDCAFAAKLLKQADSLKDSPALQALIYEKAYAFGSRAREGYDTAIAAMNFLSDLVPARKIECQDNILKVHQLAYRAARSPEEKKQTGGAVVSQMIALADLRAEAGDWTEAGTLYRQAQGIASYLRLEEAATIRARLRRLASRQELARKIADLKGRLQANPRDQDAAKQVALLLVTEMDSPEKAAPFAELSGDQVLQNYVLVAAMSLETLPEKACLDLGEWYADLAAGATEEGQVTALGRAAKYLERYMAVHEAQDAPRLKAKMDLDKVKAQLAKLDATPPAETATARTLRPRTVSAETVQYAKLRSRLPLAQQVTMISRKLREDNGNHEIRFQPPTRGEIARLSLSGNADLVNIDALFGLPLEELMMRECFNFNGGFAALRGMPLARLDLGSCRSLDSLEGLEGLPLTSLKIADCTALKGDLSALKGMQLERFYAEGCKNLESLGGLQNMRLKDLSFRGCTGLKGDLSGLRGNRLVSLDLTGCEGLEGLAGIETMPLQDIQLRGCTALKGDLSALKGMKLTNLRLTGCRSLERLHGIEGMPLERIDLMECASLKDISALRGMKLKRLDLMNCESLESLRGLEGMALADLGLHGCKALTGDLSALRGMPLETLDLYGCAGIESIKGIEKCPLKFINLRGCAKVPRDEVLSLGDIPTLTRLSLDDPALADEVLGRRGRRGGS